MLGILREGRMRRGAFVAWGAALMALKVGVDWVAFRVYARPWTPAFYVNPEASHLTAPGGDFDPLMLTVLASAVPFMAAGLILTLRRLRDAGLPTGLAALFFVPFAKFLFFAVAAAAPSHDARAPVDLPGGPFRGGAVKPPRAPLRRGVAFLVASALGATVGLGAVGVSVWLLRDYGVAMFIFAPGIATFTSTLLLHRLAESVRLRDVLLAASLAFVGSFAVMFAFAVEGAVCLVMASPLLAVIGFVSAVIGHGVAGSLPRYALAGQGASALALLPLSFAAERAAPTGDAQAAPIESAIEVDAPPDVVWKRVVAFPPLDPPTEWIFRAGVAAPLRATIEGQGVGAVRRCEFTTGTFVEPIDTWTEGRELAFRVASEPDPMREWTPWPGPRPPHLDRGLHSTRGQFLLEPLPGGRARLVGRTWYAVNMAPAAYWRLWGDAMIHTIHMRVLRHIAKLAESDAHPR
jgi:hypothetical protein